MKLSELKLVDPEAWKIERGKANDRARRWRQKPESKVKETANRKRWRERHKDRDRASRQRWVAKNPHKIRAQHRRRAIRRYGLTVEGYAVLFQEQGNKCAICLSDHQRSKFDWAIDHCHDTGKVRGILCHNCNAIVNKRSTPEILRRAAEYLERHG